MKVQVSTHSVGGVAHYSCPKGHVMQGNSTRICLKNGIWNGRAPICNRKLFRSSKMENHWWGFDFQLLTARCRVKLKTDASLLWMGPPTTAPLNIIAFRNMSELVHIWGSAWIIANGQGKNRAANVSLTTLFCQKNSLHVYFSNGGGAAGIQFGHQHRNWRWSHTIPATHNRNHLLQAVSH